MSRDWQVYYYWDDLPGSSMPGYISLCLESWSRHSKADGIVRINLDNVESITGGALTARQLQLFTPAQRSDATMAAIMSSRRGLFMDADTVLLPSFDPDRYMMKDKPSFYAKFAKGFAEPLLAFGASPHHDRRFTSRWVTETLRAIRREDRSWARRARRVLRTCLGKTAHVKWDYLGARILDPLAFDSQTRWAAEFIDAKSSGFLPGAGDEGYGPASVNAYWLGAGSDQLFSPAA